VFYHQVDNPLVRICDPEFLGFHVLNHAQASTKVVAKRNPQEPMGAVVRIGQQTTIIEYSDLPESLADRRDENGQPVFWAGSTAVHVFDRSFLEHMATNPQGLPFHSARKKVGHLTPDEQWIAPQDLQQPNAIKFERFIFDVLAQAEIALLVEADRRQEFSPVKNADGADCPATARAAMLARDAEWIRSSGCQLDADAQVEISPLYALDAQDVAGQLFAGMQLGGRIYLNADLESE
ncbi:MAG: UTP--glucose-1-phosphate uridylyltransferase, partial [Planctomycetaceae bacterium]